MYLWVVQENSNKTNIKASIELEFFKLPQNKQSAVYLVNTRTR